MENLKIVEFTSSGYGYGYGYGSGYGSESGKGYGHGYGFEDAYGSGGGYGYGSGSGGRYGRGDRYGDESGDRYGYGTRYIKRIDGNQIYNIDGVPTILRRIRGNYAKGAILNADLSTSPCFIAKQDRIFAHGETLSEAVRALRDKLFMEMPEEERINAFLAEHAGMKAYPVMDFFEWHSKLTGSCEMGRRDFAKRHGIDLNGEMTVEEFIRLTENDYGGEIIKKLKPLYGM